MDLPVEKWKLLVSRKLTSLEPALKEKLRCTVSLRDSFLLCLSLLSPEDEECLFNLSRYYSVKKDPDLFLFCKEKGNQKFREKQYRTATVLYSRALSHTETGSPEMAVCYANRSAALFHLGQFEICLEDIERALAEGYPDRLLHKILLRKTECLLSLGRPQKALEILDSVENKISADQSANAASCQVLLCKCSQLREKACRGSSCIGRQPAFSDGTQTDLGDWEESRRVACASPSVNLNFSPCKGRHLVASKAIHPGELLVREEAFMRVLCPGTSLLLRGSKEAVLDGQLANEDLYCHHCLKRLLASIPCQGCSYAKYCSHTCAQVAWRNYHRMECPLGGLLLALGVFCHLALRVVLASNFEEIRRLIKQSHREDAVNSLSEAQFPRAGTEGSFSSIPGCDADGRYDSCYRTVFSLLTHIEKHTLEFRFLCSLTAAALCRRIGDASLQGPIFGKRTFTGAEDGEAAAPSSELNVLGEAVLRHLLQLQCNAQAVTVLHVSVPDDGPVAASNQVHLATALFPVVSLLNHSCDPNTSVTFKGSVAEVRALRSVSEEEEILHCYGPHRCNMEAKERRERLRSQYFFECQCQPCLEELRAVSRDGAPSCQSLFRCPSCHRFMQGEDLLQCPSKACGVLVPEDDFRRRLRELQLQIEKAVKVLEHGEPGHSRELLLKCRLEAERFLSPAHLTAGKIEDSLAWACSLLGNWQDAARHLRLSIQAVEAHYGPSSVEMGRELFKLAQVCFNGQAVSEALCAIQKAEDVLSVHLGAGDAQVQELRAMKACLEELPNTFKDTAAP